MRLRRFTPALRTLAPILFGARLFAAPDREPGPSVESISVRDGQARVGFAPYPAALYYEIERSGGLEGPFSPVPGRVDSDHSWTGPAGDTDMAWFRVRAHPLDAGELTGVHLLNRIAYGPTPDALARLRAIGPDAYIGEQLAPETIDDVVDVVPPFSPRWRRMTVTGTASSSVLYVYLEDPGNVYLDDIRLVAGAGDDGSRTNLLTNGSFEQGLSTGWTVSPNHAASALSTAFRTDGRLGLHLVATEGGTSRGSSIYQTLSPRLSIGQTYTLSYWYLTRPDDIRLTLRLSGSGIVSRHRLDPSEAHPAAIRPRLEDETASITDLRTWHTLRAVQSRRQLNEVLRQFVENHFVTEYTKSREYFDRYLPGEQAGQVATAMEYRENRRWAEALLRPDATFHDLLRISAESPAMIIYLDTVNSRGDGRRIANENYARELCELFCFGVDNGYGQGDIVEISKAWTGWTVDILPPGEEGNPFAGRSTVVRPGTTNDPPRRSDLLGTWALRYRAERHNPTVKHLFHARDAEDRILTDTPLRVPERFGPPWAGRAYGLRLANGTGNAGMQDGYQVLRHMADQPFTQEFISVKLCRLLVHDDFHIGHDFTDAESTPEERLIHACMMAWENPPGGGPRGRIRDVLRVILESDLFRSHAAISHKVRDPLEFGVAAVRALRVALSDGTHAATTDGEGLLDMMNRAGRMRLFDRAEPDGYPEDGPGWISAGTLAERLRFLQAALHPPGPGRPGDAGDTFLDPLAVIGQWIPQRLNEAGAVVDVFLDLLFPAEGPANLARYRELAVGYLDTGDDGVTPSPFADLEPGSPAFGNRVRGMVAFLMTSPRFQEQ